MGARWSTSVAAPPISTAYNLPVREGMLTVGTVDGRVRLVDAATRMTRWEVQSYPANHFCSVAVSPDGRFVASVGESEEHWKIFDAASGVVCVTGPRHDGTGACLCRVTRSGHRTLLDEGCPVHAHTAGLEVVAFSPCGQTLATGGGAFTVILWDAQTGKAELMLEKLTDWVTSVSFSADGARLASGSVDSSIHVWDAITGALLRAIPDAHGSLVTWVQFAPTDGRRLASSGYDNTLKQWDINSGAMISSVEGDRFAVPSPDGRTIATAGGHCVANVLLFDAATGALRFRMVGHQDSLFSAALSPDGSMLAAGSFAGTCKVWDSSTGALRHAIELEEWICCISMGQHPRLGAGSQVLGLDEELLRMILDRV